jgi:hypothetical protein
LFFAFLEIFSISNQLSKTTHSHSTKCQNIQTAQNQPRSLSSSILLQWLGFGFGWPEAQNRDQTLGLRSDFPVFALTIAGAQVRSLLLLIQSTALSTSVQARRSFATS